MVPLGHVRNLLLVLAAGSGLVSCQPVAPRPGPGASVVNTGIFVADNGRTIRADYRADDTVTLTFADGSTKVLDQAVSASGSRYVAGRCEWWEHQGEATYSTDDKPVFVGARKR